MCRKSAGITENLQKICRYYRKSAGIPEKFAEYLQGVAEKSAGITEKNGKPGGLMVSALVSGSSSPGSSPDRGRCVVFLGKTLNSHSASLHPVVKMGTGEFNAGG